MPKLKEVRRHGWLQDYQYHLDQGPDRTIRNAERNADMPAPQSPVNINININLGDIIDRLVKGKTSTKEALTEMVKTKKQMLIEDE